MVLLIDPHNLVPVFVTIRGSTRNGKPGLAESVKKSMQEYASQLITSAELLYDLTDQEVAWKTLARN